MCPRRRLNMPTFRSAYAVIYDVRLKLNVSQVGPLAVGYVVAAPVTLRQAVVRTRL